MVRSEDWVDPADKIDASQKKYQTSDKGKEALKRYRQSDQGKQAQERYRQSGRGKTAHERYRNSDKGREAQVRAKSSREEVKSLVEKMNVLIKERKRLGLCIYCGKEHEKPCYLQVSPASDA